MVTITLMLTAMTLILVRYIHEISLHFSCSSSFFLFFLFLLIIFLFFFHLLTSLLFFFLMLLFTLFTQLISSYIVCIKPLFHVVPSFSLSLVIQPATLFSYPIAYLSHSLSFISSICYFLSFILMSFSVSLIVILLLSAYIFPSHFLFLFSHSLPPLSLIFSLSSPSLSILERKDAHFHSGLFSISRGNFTKESAHQLRLIPLRFFCELDSFLCRC